jgi:ammonium transporter, Amt family
MPALYASFLGLLTQVGFALLTCGLVRKKNAAHLVMLTFSAYVFAFLAYYTIGYAFQSGFRGFFFRGVSSEERLLVDIAFMLVAGYILVGAVCERITFRAFVLCELFLGGVLYPVFAQWVWGGGWLSRIGSSLGLAHGFVDFGGSSVVHELGGFCAMALAMVLGPRLGKYGHDGQPRPFLAHNIVFVTTGTVVVLVGWAALVAGSSADAALAGRIAININIAGVAGAAAAMLFWYWSYGKPDISMACNGMLAGLVGISAAAPFVGRNAALIIGAVAGVLASAGVLLNERTLRIDDPCGSVAVHGYCGCWGAIAVGLFADGTHQSVTGLFHGDWKQLVAQLLGTTVCALFAFALTLAVFAVVNRTSPMRVDPDIEAEGIDLNEFGMLAYPEDDGV